MAKTKKTREVAVEAPRKTVLKGRRLTEKAVLLSDARGIYAFNVEKGATKKQVAASVKAEFKVTPIKVHLLASQGVGKKAYVTLKKGDKID